MAHRRQRGAEGHLAAHPVRDLRDRMGEPKWVKRFTEDAATGTYLRVIVPGEIKAGDRIEVISRPRTR